ncbi:MAG: two-component sensor histidine kinase [Alphaproteobacteria bacterium]|nr:two-component sensor histidine kinase [Alphaproteobacteria bacterium]
MTGQETSTATLGFASAEGELDGKLEIGARSWIKLLLPRTMFGRSLLIVVAPLVLVQAIATWVFYDRHWAAVSWRLAAGVVGDIALVIEEIQHTRFEVDINRLLDRAAAVTDLEFALSRGETIDPPPASSGTLLEDQLVQAMKGRVDLPYRIDSAGDPRGTMIQVQLAQGVLKVAVPSKRLFSPTTYIFVMWMVGSSAVLLAVATVFLRNQIKSLRRLAAAADGFGKGRPVPFFKVEGAVEVRQAAIAFLTMRDRIQRQIRQRTQMLAGVSHDLRTPLTRMKLAVELLRDEPTVEELKSDVAEMERMVNGYLEFARGEGTETAVETDISLLLEDVAAGMRREGTPLSVLAPAEYIIPVRPNALRRCITNLIDNARRHGNYVWLTGVDVPDGIDILIEDDGPGIPAADRGRAFRAFVRLDPSRNASTGGVGLGLTIARDVARSHGGEITLDASPHGGLRARVHLPR